MKQLSLRQLKDWYPCDGWTDVFKKTFGTKAAMVAVEKELLKRKDFSALNWLIGKRLERFTKRHACAFAYLCSHRALKYARKQDIEVLKKAQSFARMFALTGKVDVEAARAAARAAESSACSAEYRWQLKQLARLKVKLPTRL